MVLDLLGPSLENLFNYCGRKFSLKTVLLLAVQLIHRVKYVHSKNFLHQDIKLENFLMGVGSCGNIAHVTDLGLARSTAIPRWTMELLLPGSRSYSYSARHVLPGSAAT